MKAAYTLLFWLAGTVRAQTVDKGMISQSRTKLTRLTLCTGRDGQAESVSLIEQHHEIDGFANHGGWVNPEDLKALPQCIAQQDTSAWLDAMTKCTRNGVPIYCVLAVLLISLLAFLQVSNDAAVVLSWFVSLVRHSLRDLAAQYPYVA